MKDRRYSRVLKRSALSAALGLCFATSPAFAQSNAAGAIFGEAPEGETIRIENPATGFSREVSVGADGSFRLSSLPIGDYNVTVRRTDGTTTTRENIRVSVGTGTPVIFVGGAEAGPTTTLNAITVTGTQFINPIDVSSVESSTVLTAERIAKIPVARDISSVALLAPGTVKGDAAFGNLASFGGSSVAENQYYVNGFNVTNTFKNLNFTQIPFQAIAEQQIKTGGYGAEFGRSTGGVVNIITKRGTNEFKAGANVFWYPEELSETNPDLYYNDGRLVTVNSEDEFAEMTGSVWAGGALVKNRLFAYGLLQYRRTDTASYPGVEFGDANSDEDIEAPMWLLRMDWNINDSNLLTFTGFSDKREYEETYFKSDYDDQGNPIRGDYLGTEYTENGGTGYSLKYTGYLTDTFTLSALAGRGEFHRYNYAVAANGTVERYEGNLFGPVPGCPPIADLREFQTGGPIVGCSFAGRLGRPDNEDTREQFRVDAEWWLGDHLLTFGYDRDDFESQDGEAYEGGFLYYYYDSQGDFVRRYNIRQSATVAVEQEAFYIEDAWNITDDFLLNIGLRWDSFTNLNGDGKAYVEIENQFGPRLGFSWDITGDSRNKLFGNAGRYALPLTSNVAVRGASASLYAIQDFRYSGRDPVTAEPLNLTVDPSLPLGLPFFANGESGQPKDPRTIAATNLEPMYQDEFILGYQHQFNENISGGVRGVHRILQRAIDDTCDIRPYLDYAEENGLKVVINPAFTYCHLFNPGYDQTFTVDINGDGTLETVDIPADVLGPEAERKYSAVEFFFEGNWEKFFLQGSYTWSHNYGNTEGGVKSDIGQADTGITQDFDYPELMIGSSGNLPNDRRHAFKLFGSYQLTDELSFGANFLAQSGRPLNCIGVYGSDPTGYRASYFSCDAENPPPGSNDNGTTIVPRGSVGETDWLYDVGVNVRYQPAMIEGLTLKMDVLNLFNFDTATSLDEFGENDNGQVTAVADSYLTPTSWQQPRRVRFMVQYEF